MQKNRWLLASASSECKKKGGHRFWGHVHTTEFAAVVAGGPGVSAETDEAAGLRAVSSECKKKEVTGFGAMSTRQ